MNCTTCGHQNSEQAKFCGECGKALAFRCPACSADIAPGLKFCTDCGYALTMVTPAPLPPTIPHVARLALERRQLTVMFCDLVDSTALSSRLDPEDLREVIRCYQSATSDVITRYEGHVAQFLGDGLLVYFGYPQAHEDDAARAVHAGLGIFAATAALGPRLQTPLELAVRIGIHSGLVVIGAHDVGGNTETLAIGETPNIAARLQNLAIPGTMVVSEITRQLLGGQFDLEDLGDHALKGVTQPIKVSRVCGVSRVASRFEAATHGHLTPLVGRAQEIGLLTDRWQWAQEGAGQVVVISGEPGLGKSRLVRELRKALGDEAANVLRFQCSPYHKSSAYYPLIDHLERALSLPANTTPAQKLDALEHLVVTTHRLSLQHALLLANLLSIPSGTRYPALTTTPPRQKEDTIAAAVDLTLAVSRPACALLLFEDAHWADPTTLDFLDLLISRTSSARLLVLLTHRPEFVVPWSHGHMTALALSHLSRSQSSAIVSRLTANKTLPDGLLDQIVAKTDGVPLFVEELTRSLLESDQLRDCGDHFEYSGVAGALRVPSTLRDSLMARLDRVPMVKEIAQMGAAIGRDFSYRLIEAIASLEVHALQRALQRLEESGLASRRGAIPAAVYTFKHALVQDAAYDSLVRTQRQALHAAIANALEQQMPQAKDTAPELFAHHYTAAGMVNAAIPLWQKAGALALAKEAVQEAVSHLSQGLALVSALAESRTRHEMELELQILLGQAWTALRGWQSNEVATALKQALLLAKALDRYQALLPIYYGLFTNILVQGRIIESTRWINEAFEAAARHGDLKLKRTAHVMACVAYTVHGDWLKARENAHSALSIHADKREHSLRQDANMESKITIECYATHWTWAFGFADEAARISDAKDALAADYGSHFIQGFALTYGAFAFDFRGEPARLRERAERAIQVGRDAHLPLYSELLGPMMRGIASFRAGDVRTGIAEMRNSLTRLEAAGFNILVPYAKSVLAHALLCDEDSASALDIIEDSLAQMERPGWEECAWLSENLRIKGLILKQLGRAEEAEASLRRAIAVAREQHAKSWELRATTALAALWQKHGRQREAYEMLAPLYAWFTEGFGTKDLIDAKTLLGRLAE